MEKKLAKKKLKVKTQRSALTITTTKINKGTHFERKAKLEEKKMEYNLISERL